MPPVMSTVQAAAFLGTSSEYVRREILRHRLKALVLRSESGRRIYRISAVELRRYLARYGE